ncbi:MAG: long-chain fatty acid--CoA ligase [Chloroflexi bacterium]|nr:long-chain fatty acid--CoA ligase [Chloroflexota bacterium]
MCGHTRLTYAQVDSMANRLAQALQDHGLRRGDRVVLYLLNSVALVVGIFAVLKANGVFVVINATTKQDKLAYMVNNCQAQAMIARGKSAALIEAVKRKRQPCSTLFLQVKRRKRPLPTRRTAKPSPKSRMCMGKRPLPTSASIKI